MKQKIPAGLNKVFKDIERKVKQEEARKNTNEKIKEQKKAMYYARLKNKNQTK